MSPERTAEGAKGMSDREQYMQACDELTDMEGLLTSLKADVERCNSIILMQAEHIKGMQPMLELIRELAKAASTTADAAVIQDLELLQREHVQLKERHANLHRNYDKRISNHEEELEAKKSMVKLLKDTNEQMFRDLRAERELTKQLHRTIEVEKETSRSLIDKNTKQSMQLTAQRQEITVLKGRLATKTS